MDTLTPIPTRFDGILFRSRTEARWAVLFKHLDLKYRYEDEGFQLPSFWYLPDFWLPEWRAFAEVKGSWEQWDAIALGKARELAVGSGRPVLLLDELEPNNLYVRTLAQDGCEFLADIPNSMVRGRLWYETEAVANRDEWSIASDTDWQEAVSRAALWRFDHRARR